MYYDGALQQKLDAYVATQEIYAQALANHKLVPDVMIQKGEGVGNSSSLDLVDLLSAKTAKDLSLSINPQSELVGGN